MLPIIVLQFLALWYPINVTRVPRLSLEKCPPAFFFLADTVQASMEVTPPPGLYLFYDSLICTSKCTNWLKPELWKHQVINENENIIHDNMVHFCSICPLIGEIACHTCQLFRFNLNNRIFISWSDFLTFFTTCTSDLLDPRLGRYEIGCNCDSIVWQI